ncbi:MAG: hypothetical protein ACOCX7_03435 [Bacteroidota bacterium]
MKNFVVTLSIMLSIAFIASGCSNQTQRDNFFGYDNDPEKETSPPAREETSYAARENDEWRNPLSGDQTTAAGGAGAAYRADYVDRTYYDQMYVPVIVPWWSHYYGWLGRYRSGIHISVHHGGYWGWDWYSPWYDYHPHYGYYWPRYYPVHHNWYYQPVYSYHKKKVEKDEYRNFGPSRGDYSKGAPGRTSKDGYRYRSAGQNESPEGRYRSTGQSRESGRQSGAEEQRRRNTGQDTRSVEPRRESRPGSSGSSPERRSLPESSTSTPPSSGSSGSGESGGSDNPPQRRKSDGALRDVFNPRPENAPSKGPERSGLTGATNRSLPDSKTERRSSADAEKNDIFRSTRPVKTERPDNNIYNTAPENSPARRTYTSPSNTERSTFTKPSGNTSKPSGNYSAPSRKSSTKPSGSYQKPSGNTYTAPKTQSIPKSNYTPPRRSTRPSGNTSRPSGGYSKPSGSSYSKPSAPSRRTSAPSGSSKSSGSSSKPQKRSR